MHSRSKKCEHVCVNSYTTCRKHPVEVIYNSTSVLFGVAIACIQIYYYYYYFGGHLFGLIIIKNIYGLEWIRRLVGQMRFLILVV